MRIKNRRYFPIPYFFLIALCENFINNQKLLQRFPNWDLFWIDTQTYSQIFDNQKSFSLLNFPQINLHSGFGIQSIQEKMFQNPFNAFNILLNFPISPAQYVNVRTILFLTIMGLGTYFFLLDYTKNKQLTLFLSSISTALPLFWGMLYGWLGLYSITCSIPMLLYLFSKNKREPKWSNLIYIFAILDLVGFDLLSTCVFFVFLISFIITELLFLPRPKQIFLSIPSLIISFSVTLTFLVPFGSYLIRNFSYLHKMQIHSVNQLTLYGYLKLFISDGAFSIFYPYEGSGILLYLPAFFWVILIFYTFQNFKRVFKRSDTFFLVGPKYYLSFSLILGFLPLIPYAFPFLRKFAPSYFRSQLNICSILVFLASSIVIVKLDLQKNRILKIVAASLITEIFLFFLPPWILLANYVHKLSLASKIFVIHGRLYSNQLLRTIRFPEIFYQNIPWVNLILGNLVVFSVILLLKRPKVAKRYLAPSTLISTGLLCLFVTTTYFVNELDLKRYESGWQQAVSDDYRIKNYEARTSFWIKKYHIDDQNYRLIPAGLDSYYPGSGRNAKLIADTELNSSFNINAIFQYREVDDPATSLKYFALECNQNCDYKQGQGLGSYAPPTVSQVVSNTSWLRHNGVKFVVLADAQIHSPAFKLLDTYNYPRKFGYDPTESGYVSLYQLQNAFPIATSTTRGAGEIRIQRIGLNGISLQASRSDNQDVVLRYIFSKNYKAYQGNRTITISELSDGFMELHDVQGSSQILVKYQDGSYNSGIFLTVFFAGLGFFIQRMRKSSKFFSNSEYADVE